MKNLRIQTMALLLALVSAPGAIHLKASENNNARPKIGLALSGGGARGAAHIGVLKVFEQERIPIDYIAGTSFGALVGGLYAEGYSAEEIETIFLSQKWDDIFDESPKRVHAPIVQKRAKRYLVQLDVAKSGPELPMGMLRGQKLSEILSRYTASGIAAAGNDFDRLPIPFRAVATDILTGNTYLFKRGSMAEALRASISIPGVFSPVEKDKMLLVDGGLSDNLPCDVVQEMGADIIIAVDVTSPLYSRGEIKTLFKVLDQSISLLMRKSVDENLKKATLFLIRSEID